MELYRVSAQLCGENAIEYTVTPMPPDFTWTCKERDSDYVVAENPGAAIGKVRVVWIPDRVVQVEAIPQR